MPFFLQVKSNVFLSSLPWEGIIKLILTGLGIIVSVIASSPQQSEEYVSNIRYATIYLFFALSGKIIVIDPIGRSHNDHYFHTCCSSIPTFQNRPTKQFWNDYRTWLAHCRRDHWWHLSYTYFFIFYLISLYL